MEKTLMENDKLKEVTKALNKRIAKKDQEIEKLSRMKTKLKGRFDLLAQISIPKFPNNSKQFRLVFWMSQHASQRWISGLTWIISFNEDVRCANDRCSS